MLMSNIMTKVGFLIAGVQKAGTTALDAYLRQHPQICMAQHKEVHFFDNEKIFNSKAVDYSIYHSYFSADHTQHRVLGETTPAYMFWYSSPSRIWQYNSGMRLIVILRNPVERAYSHWNMQRLKGRDERPFLEAVQSEYTKCMEFLPLQCREFSYLARGFYTEQIRRILTFFPKKQLLVLKTDDLKCNVNKTMADIWSFLNVEEFLVEPITSDETNSAGYQRGMSRKERAFLLQLYEYEIRQLERMLAWNCSDWLK